MSGGLDPEALKASKELDKLISKAYAIESDKVKLLLLGAGESGKSTIFKQMRVLFGAPLTEEEKNQITPVVYSNTISSMKMLAQAVSQMGYEEEVRCLCETFFQISASILRKNRMGSLSFFPQVAEENKDQFALIMSTDDEGEINNEIGAAIQSLWKDPGVLLAWKRRAEFQIVESVKYYFNEIGRIMEDDYVANQQDMLLARVRTSGIVTEKYVIDGKDFEMYDVGGQRNERKKWIHCFDDVTAVIFVAALSEYDQVLFEDSSTNRMVEAVELFDEICNNRYFMTSNMILFLNKRDLFEEKILSVHIGDQKAFEDFDTPMGSPDYYDNGVAYFLQKFTIMNTNPDRQVYNHVTCATDSENVKVVFNACKDIILRGNMTDAGLQSLGIVNAVFLLMHVIELFKEVIFQNMIDAELVTTN